MSFELNLATLPNSLLYIEGVQLSYIKVYVHIFNLWYSNSPCYISNPEFVKRTGLHKDTVINAIHFFEKNGLLKRVQKGTRRYLVQTTRFLETENEIVDKSPKNCANIDKGSELDRGGSELDPPQGSELDRHNNKYNNKYNKSSYMGNEQKKNKAVDNSTSTKNGTGKKEDWKESNQKKHSGANGKEAPTADVTKQSTSYDPDKHSIPSKCDPQSAGYQAFVDSNPYLKRKREARKAAKLPTGTDIQSEIPPRSFTDVQGATIDARGCQDIPPNVRGSDGLLEARGVYSFLEEAGMAGENRAHQHSKS